MLIGSVVVDGVRKSTRKRKNPYSKTEYVPVPKLAPLPGDSELEEDAEDWVSQCYIFCYLLAFKLHR